MRRLFAIPLILTLAGCAGELAPEAPDLVLWYDEPAAEWLEALPVGNGRLGAMIFGGAEKERIQLNEESVWAGPPVPEPRDDGAAALEFYKSQLAEMTN